MSPARCSIIIPMFNEINNIASCLDTLKKQTCKNFEAIFIDDGSTDGSAAKLAELLTDNNDFPYKIINQANTGAARARQTGIDSAQTDLIMILDCDDHLSNDAVEKALESISKYNADISMFDLVMIDQNGSEIGFDFFEEKDVYTGEECLYNSLGGWKTHGLTLCKKSIYLKSYHKYKEHNEADNYINNDEVITRLNFSNASRVVRNKGKYFYSYNTNSTTKRVNKNRYLILNNAIILHELFHDNKNINSQVDREVLTTYKDIMRYFFKNSPQIPNKREWKNNIMTNTKEIYRRGIFKSATFKEKRKLIKLAFKVFIAKA